MTFFKFITTKLLFSEINYIAILKKRPFRPVIVSLLLLICYRICLQDPIWRFFERTGTVYWLCNKSSIPVSANSSRLWAVKCRRYNKIDSMINYWAIHNFTREHRVLLLSPRLFHIRPKIQRSHSDRYIISYKNSVHPLGTSKTALFLDHRALQHYQKKTKETWYGKNAFKC